MLSVLVPYWHRAEKQILAVQNRFSIFWTFLESVTLQVLGKRLFGLFILYKTMSGNVYYKSLNKMLLDKKCPKNVHKNVQKMSRKNRKTEKLIIYRGISYNSLVTVRGIKHPKRFYENVHFLWKNPETRDFFNNGVL